MPLIVFGAGCHGKDSVRLKGHRNGITDKIYRRLKQRDRNGELLLLDIDEYRTSKVKYIYAIVSFSQN
jgi:hypothetical protein